MVIDWRAPVSAGRSTGPAATEPMGVEPAPPVRLPARRAHRATRTSTLGDPARRGRRHSQQILSREIERPRVGPMRDIVATIQPEQDDIVRADLGESVCVQGAPGTGKTAVGLHRAAYLLYAHRDQLTRQGVLVVGPNASSCATSATCCPRSARSTRSRPRSRSWSARRCPADAVRRRRRRRPARRSRATPGWPRCCTGRCGRAVQRADRGAGRAARRRGAGGSRRTRSRRSLDELRARGRAVRRRPRRCSPQRLAHADPGEDGGRRRVPRRPGAGRGRAQPRRSSSTSTPLWPAVDPARLVLRLLADAGLPGRGRRRAAHRRGAGAAAVAEAAAAPRTPRRGRSADAVLIDEVADLLERTPSLGARRRSTRRRTSRR